jgi:hypothetical protein
MMLATKPHESARSDEPDGFRHPRQHRDAAGILTHRSDRLDQSGGYGETSPRLRCRMLLRVDCRRLILAGCNPERR